MFVMSAPAHIAVPGVLACAFAAVVVWAAMLRPGVSATADELRMRTLFESVTIPLAAIDAVLVRRYLLVRAGGNRYICPAISRPLRKTVRSEMKWNGGPQVLAPGAAITKDATRSPPSRSSGQGDIAYPDFVEQQIRTWPTTRAARGIEERSEEEYELGSQAVRRNAWPVIGGLAVLGAAFVVALVVL